MNESHKVSQIDTKIYFRRVLEQRMQVGPEILAWAADLVSTLAVFTPAMMSYCASGIKYDGFWK